MRLLLVEDSLRLQSALGTGLRKAGYVVDVTGDGLEGLWLAENNDYDTIILDLMLPGLDGLSRLRQGAHNPARDHPHGQGCHRGPRPGPGGRGR